MKKVLFTIALTLTTVIAFGQIKSVKSAYKAASMDKPDFKLAESEIKGALENPETKDVAETWWTAGYIQDRKFELEKIKVQLGQKADDSVMYPALMASYDYYMKAVELDSLPDAKGKVKPKYTKKIKESLLANHNFFINGGAYGFDQNDYKKAYSYFDTYLRISENKLFEEANLKADTNYLNVKFYRAVAASQMNDSELAIKSYEELKDDNFRANEVYQYLCFELDKIKDTVRLEKTLIEAVGKFPEEAYYIQSLINIYIFSDRTDDALKYLDQAISKDPKAAQLWDVKGRLFETKQNIEKAKECFAKALEIDPQNYDALLDMGRLYFNDAVKANDEINNIKDQKEYRAAQAKVNEQYKVALPYFQKAHQAKPEAREAMVALRSIYYKLDMGKELEEIEAKMNM